MKRALARTLAIAAFLAFGAAAFAQLTFNGYYRTGGVYDSDMTRTYTTGVKNMIDLADRIRLNISYAAPDDMYGFKSRLQADTGYTSSGQPTSAIAMLFSDQTGTFANVNDGKTYDTWTNWKFAEGYAKLLDGMIKISAGRLDITDYEVVQNTANIYLGDVYSDEYQVNKPLLGGQKGNTTGAIVQVFPIENFSAAAVVRADDTAAYKTHHYGFDAYYMLPGIGKALFNSNLGYYGNVPSAGSTSAATNNTYEKLSNSVANLGFSYTAFPGLSATAVYRYNGYVTNNKGQVGKYANGAVGIFEYTQGPLFADIATDCDFNNSHEYVEGEVSYLIVPQFKVRGYFGYTDSTTAGAGTNNVIQQYVDSVACNSLIGVDFVVPIGKAEASLGYVYTDKAGVQIPLLVKANF
jgi:hypothetical protein